MLEYHDLCTNPKTGFVEQRWVNLADPTDNELHRVALEFNIPMDFLQDSLDPAERPHLVEAGAVRLLINRASIEKEDLGCILFLVVPFGIIITPGVVITICRDASLIQELIPDNSHLSRDRPGICLMLTLLQHNSTRFIQHLEDLDTLTGTVEKRMRESMRNADLVRMMQIEKSLVYFSTALKANELALERVLHSQTFLLHPDERGLLEDALVECHQASSSTEVYVHIISSISDTSASMISNNMNIVMKFLAAVTLLMTIPTVIVGAYGMNVPLPFQKSRYALPVILACTGVFCWSMWKYLRKRNWM